MTFHTPSLRATIRKFLIQVVLFIGSVRSSNFPCLKSIRLPGLTKHTFAETTKWEPIEEVSFAFCYKLLHSIGIQLLGEDGHPLLPLGYYSRRQVLSNLFPDLVV